MMQSDNLNPIRRRAGQSIERGSAPQGDFDMDVYDWCPDCGGSRGRLDRDVEPCCCDDDDAL